MQIASLILNPAIFHLIKTFKHYFSKDFEFDLCYDLGFWKTEASRCIPRTLNHNEHYKYYSFPPLCDRTEFDCMDAFITLRNYCPNQDESCAEEQHFFCNESKTCIPNGNNFAYIHSYSLNDSMNFKIQFYKRHVMALFIVFMVKMKS